MIINDRNDKIKTENDVIETLKSFSEFSGELIEKCADMVNRMNIKPDVRRIIDDEFFGSGVAFDYYNGKFIIEIFVSYEEYEEITGYIAENDERESNFEFDSADDAVNFWNLITEKLT